MKYMILIYDNAQSREQFHSEEGAALMAEVNAIMAEITESGEMIGGEALADPSNTKTIRLAGRRASRHRRPAGRGQGALRWLSAGRVRDARACRRDRAALAQLALHPARGAAAHEPRRSRDVSTDTRVEDRLRALAPQVLGALVRRHGQFDACEDAVQEALIAAAAQWPQEGVPDNPRAWLLTVAGRRLTDAGAATARDGHARTARWRPSPLMRASHRGPTSSSRRSMPTPRLDEDDTLSLLLHCCHPELSAPSQIALTLRAVGGLTTAEIASAFLVPEATMAQRISRAKARIRATGTVLPWGQATSARSGCEPCSTSCTSSSTRATRQLGAGARAHGPDRRGDPADARGPRAAARRRRGRGPARADAADRRAARARTAADGSLVPLAEQDRGRWNAQEIAEGVALITDALAGAPLGPYQAQAAIAAVHAEATDAERDRLAADRRALPHALERIAPNPMVTLNHAVAVAMVDGPAGGLRSAGHARRRARREPPAHRGARPPARAGRR